MKYVGKIGQYGSWEDPKRIALIWEFLRNTIIVLVVNLLSLFFLNWFATF
jgi:hypothetical protein